ncbi:MAG TPA: hypothetical protein VHG70_11410 [Nocardioidaceae bacterium]|nr:hypothetical protein [Nocardioidaceae bacterium]
MMTKFAACALTGQEADADGVCLEHATTRCVIAVQVSPPLFECVIPGFQCTHRHDIRTVEWPPIGPAVPGNRP